MEVGLRPDLAIMRALGEVRWYSRVDEPDWIFKIGVSWLRLTENDRQILKQFLKAEEK
jgi:hypothetical protein